MENDGGVGPAWLVRGLSYSYPDGTKALDSVSLSVDRGARVAVVGPNGAGKSTLFLCSLGIMEGWEGEISFFGVRVEPGNYDDVRRKVGLVFQEPDDMLFMPTVFDDVAFGPLNSGLGEGEVRRRVEDALRSVGMWEKRNKPAHHLSVGEKRRAALACVISTGAEVLLFDEPTSGLDPRARREFMKTASELPGTLVIATHDLRMAKELCPDAILLDDGRVAAAGKTEELFADSELMLAHGLEVV